jgi:UDP-N-acetylglucosamine acyltransferase
MADIHCTAIVSAKATLGQDVQIGPYCVVGGDVVLGDRVILRSHVVVEGRTRVGPDTELFPFASIGHCPQDLKYTGEPSELVVGDHNTIREYVTMNPGTTAGGMVTKVGDGGLFMMGAHVAHDCRIGDRVIMANNATLAGHVIVEDDAIIGGLAAVHQHVRIGRRAMVGGMSGVEHDVIPFGLVMGERATLNGLNVVGLKRGGFSRDDIQALQAAYDAMFASSGTMADRLSEIEKCYGDDGPVGELLAFMRSESSRAVCRPKLEHGE